MANTIFDSMKFEPYAFREYPKALSVPGAIAEIGKPPPQVIVKDADEEERVVNQWGFSRESFAAAQGFATTAAPASNLSPAEKLAAFLAANPDVAAIASAPAPAVPIRLASDDEVPEADPLTMPFFSLQKFTLDKTGKKPANKDEALAFLREAKLIA